MQIGTIYVYVIQIGTIYVYVYVYLYIYMNIHMYYDEGSWERLRKLGGWFELQLSGGLTGGRVFELMLMLSTAGYFPISRV